MKGSKVIRVRVLIGLAILMSAWLVVQGVKNTAASGQADSFLKKSKVNNAEVGVVNKITGLPDPGTYTLHKIFPVPEYSVLDTKGKLQPISKYTKGKITLLTFFYQRCSDVNGCPYAMGIFHKVKSKLEKNESAVNSVRFVHISFDPDRDTPIMLAGLEKRNASLSTRKKSIEWDFLTTESVDKLIPIIDGFGQNVDINMNPVTGDKSLNYSHVLKVFLIDEEGFVREIYSTSYLSAEMLLNDIETLTLEKNRLRKNS
jgi:cytochrome oxidase Cu insertion factor (SCO1/SenC/PrrC family)